LLTRKRGQQSLFTCIKFIHNNLFATNIEFIFGLSKKRVSYCMNPLFFWMNRTFIF